jgi:hypothetical protein
VSNWTPKMTKSDSNEKNVVVVAVPVLEEARLLLLSTGLFEVSAPKQSASADDPELKRR